MKPPSRSEKKRRSKEKPPRRTRPDQQAKVQREQLRKLIRNRDETVTAVELVNDPVRASQWSVRSFRVALSHRYLIAHLGESYCSPCLWSHECRTAHDTAEETTMELTPELEQRLIAWAS